MAARGWVCHVVHQPLGLHRAGLGTRLGHAPDRRHLDRLATSGSTTCSPATRQFLAQRAYPVLKEAAEFFLDYMVEHPEVRLAGHRPGHLAGERLRRAGRQRRAASRWGRRATACWSTTCSPRASRRARSWAWTTEFRARLEEGPGEAAAASRSANTASCRNGWRISTRPMPNHRHTSHLLALYPCARSRRAARPELAKAARVTHRTAAGQPNWEDVEWSRANLINFFARLGDGERAARSTSWACCAKITDTEPADVLRAAGSPARRRTSSASTATTPARRASPRCCCKATPGEIELAAGAAQGLADGQRPRACRPGAGSRCGSRGKTVSWSGPWSGPNLGTPAWFPAERRRE